MYALYTSWLWYIILPLRWSPHTLNWRVINYLERYRQIGTHHEGSRYFFTTELETHKLGVLTFNSRGHFQPNLIKFYEIFKVWEKYQNDTQERKQERKSDGELPNLYTLLFEILVQKHYVKAWWLRGIGVSLVIWRLRVRFPSSLVTLLLLSARSLIWLCW